MILNDDLLRQLQAIFATEAAEHLQAINTGVLALEQQPDAEAASRLLAEIFRAAHTLKGAARSVNLESVEALSHRLETLFSRMQSEALQSRPGLFDLVYQVLDAIGTLVQASAVGTAPAVDVVELCARLELIADQPVTNDTPSPSADAHAAPKPRSGSRQQRRTQSVKPAPPAEPVAERQPQPVQPVPRSVDETVRISTTKLDALMAQVGELQVTRIGAEQRLVEVRTLGERVEAWEASWRKLRPQYRRLRLAYAEHTRPAGTNHADRGQTADRPIGRRELGTLLTFLETNEAQLRAMQAQLGELSRACQADSRRLAQVAGDLQDEVRRARMLPVSTVFDAFPRMVRDLARERGKDIRLVIQGGETEVDRSMIEQIKAPVMHLLRNAVDHGIEPAEARLAAGKPRAGTIRLVATQQAGSIVIEIADDGAGIDLERVRASSVRQGFLTAEAAEAMSDHEALWLIFRSGLSTSPTITDISGRGVGMDVVREQIERLHGMIDVDSQPGQGTRFSLTLPLTVATTLCLLVRMCGQTLALPITNVVRMTRLAQDEIGRAEGRTGIRVDGRPVMLVHLADVLDLEAPRSCSDTAARQPAIILGVAEKRVAFLVDSVVGTQEVVIKHLPRPLTHVRSIAGATILGTGEVVMIMNVTDLLRSAGRVVGRPATTLAGTRQALRQQATILVADDSITTRTMEKNILEAAGFQVHIAADGLEAWNLVQSQDVDLLVSDVNMPRLDGFELATKVRADKRLKDLPIILVTSLHTEEDRARGIAAGADAYIVKSGFDQEALLATIRRHIY
jgi:two-component system, chemotaxis family, sensor kinase CheA